MQINSKKSISTTWIVLSVIVVIAGLIFSFAYSTYNSLVGVDEEANKAWANVETVYQRRADLIPNLVNTVKGYAAHESGTLETVTRARAGLQDAYNQANAAETDGTGESFQQYQQAQQNLNRALSVYVNAVHEAYPDLKANTNFMDLQVQLEGTENRIATERTRYNEVVQRYNTKVRTFPANIFAGWFGFERREPFQADEGAKNAPTVEF